MQQQNTPAIELDTATKIIFMARLKSLGQEIAHLEDLMKVNYDKSMLASRREKARRMARVTTA